jgi:hypothetical protein
LQHLVPVRQYLVTSSATGEFLQQFRGSCRAARASLEGRNALEMPEKRVWALLAYCKVRFSRATS